MKAVILAGGLGSRLSEETENKPKPKIIAKCLRVCLLKNNSINFFIVYVFSHFIFGFFSLIFGGRRKIVRFKIFHFFGQTVDEIFDKKRGDESKDIDDNRQNQKKLKQSDHDN